MDAPVPVVHSPQQTIQDGELPTPRLEQSSVETKHMEFCHGSGRFGTDHQEQSLWVLGGKGVVIPSVEGAECESVPAAAPARPRLEQHAVEAMRTDEYRHGYGSDRFGPEHQEQSLWVLGGKGVVIPSPSVRNE